MKRSLVKIIGICFIVFMTQGFVLAQESVSLEAFITEAKANNPEILASRKRWEASIARIKLAKSLDDPTIGLAFEKIPRGTLKFNRTSGDDRMLSINQAIPAFGKLSLKGKIALMESQMFAADFKNKELEVISLLKKAYYELFLNYKETELDEVNVYFLENLGKVAEAKFKVGELALAEVLKINAETAKMQNVILNLKAERSAKQARINALLNRPLEASLDAPLLDDDEKFYPDMETLYQLTLENQPELLILSYAIEKNKFAKSLAKRSYIPDVVAGIVQRGITSGTIGPWDLALSFTVPLWFWTKQRYEVKEAIANLEEAQAAYEAMKNRAFLETKDAFIRVKVARNKMNLYKQNSLPILEGAFESQAAALRAGKGDYMQLLDAQRMLIDDTMSYYQALVEYNSGLADLERALGVNLKEVKK